MKYTQLHHYYYWLILLLLATGGNILHANWYEDFESYSIAKRNWYEKPGIPWQRITENGALIEKTQLQNGAVTQLISFRPWRYNTWYSRPLAGFNPNTAPKTITLTADVAVSKQLHHVWPFATHIAIGNVAIGISGDRIAYGHITCGKTTRKKAPLPITSFTKVGMPISAETWYEVKIEYNRIQGKGNDTATLSYRTRDDPEWIIAITDFQTNADLANDPTVYLIGDTGSPKYIGNIDNVYVKYSKIIKLESL